jgi:hypothetical protein
MYHGGGDFRSAQSSRDALTGFRPEATARAVLARLRRLFDAYTPGLPFERGRLLDSLSVVLTDAALERERLFILGWLHWLNDDSIAAEPLLAEARGRAREQNAGESLAEAAYWCARVRLLLGRGEALTEYETVLRSLGGSPRATTWFVDLLGRAGRIDRFEQVWKAVRGNRRVADCVEGPLLEARLLLQRGEMMAAERLLSEATPTSGVVWVERLLLLAWMAAIQKQPEKARNCLHQANDGPYPLSALRYWTARIEQRLRGDYPSEETTERVPPALRDFLQGQQARRQGRNAEASASYRAALSSPIARPFSRYALACLGQDDFAALLASQPGLFLALRCRERLARERFYRREIRPAEYLDALRQAVVTGYQDAAAEHFQQLAAALQQLPVEANAVRQLADVDGTDAPARNALRAALELAVRRLPPEDTHHLLLEWANRATLTDELRSLIGRQLMRLLMLAGNDEDLRAAVVRLLPGEPLLHLLSGESEPAVQESPAIRLWFAACALGASSTQLESWRDEVRQIRSETRWRGLAQALLVQEAAQRDDIAGLLTLLDDTDAWRGLPTPPNFVLRALEHAVASQPAHPGWRRSLSRWLSLWNLSALGSHGATLATHAGLTAMRGESAEAPPGMPAVSWLLHQAARALGREDAIEALAFTRRALAVAPHLASVTDAQVVRDALPEMQRLARAQRLALAAQPDGDSATIAPGILSDGVEALAETPEGAAVLDALDAGDRASACARLEQVSTRPDLSPRLAHHLALLMQRAAQTLEERDETAKAEPYWRRAWQCWLRFLVSPTTDADARRILLDWLLGQHRHRVNDLLAGNVVDGARRHWNLVRDLPAAAALEETLGRDLAERIERFREELATEYLLTTREAMRYGAIVEGWRADYDKGLTFLRRLLSLDRDNPRLLAALVEICNDWFLDLYHRHDAATLRTQLERFTPFALQLARRIDDRPGDLTARAALSDFWKFRGFLAADHEHKTALYREALRFNPANDNVRNLLAQLDPQGGRQ